MDVSQMRDGIKHIIMAEAGDYPPAESDQRRRYETGVPETEIESVPLNRSGI